MKPGLWGKVLGKLGERGGGTPEGGSVSVAAAAKGVFDLVALQPITDDTCRQFSATRRVLDPTVEIRLLPSGPVVLHHLFGNEEGRIGCGRIGGCATILSQFNQTKRKNSQQKPCEKQIHSVPFKKVMEVLVKARRPLRAASLPLLHCCESGSAVEIHNPANNPILVHNFLLWKPNVKVIVLTGNSCFQPCSYSDSKYSILDD